MCGVVEDGSMCDGQTKRGGKRDRMACCVGSQKIFLKSWNSDQRHHGEGGRVRTEESDSGGDL